MNLPNRTSAYFIQNKLISNQNLNELKVINNETTDKKFKLKKSFALNQSIEYEIKHEIKHKTVNSYSSVIGSLIVCVILPIFTILCLIGYINLTGFVKLICFALLFINLIMLPIPILKLVMSLSRGHHTKIISETIEKKIPINENGIDHFNFFNDIYIDFSTNILKRGYEFINFEKSTDLEIYLSIPTNFKLLNSSHEDYDLYDQFCLTKQSEEELRNIYNAIKIVKDELSIKTQLELAAELREANKFEEIYEEIKNEESFEKLQNKNYVLESQLNN